MEILQWFQLLNDLEASQSQSDLSLRVNNVIFVAYVLLALITKKVAPLAAFFLSVLLVDNVYMMKVSEAYMYLLVAVIYLHVFEICLTRKQVIGCGIIFLTAIFLSLDAALYGQNKTFVYRHIECISLCAHSFFISTFVSVRKIRNTLRNLINYVSRISYNSDYMLVYCYNSLKSNLLQ